uniref:Uncharacterized protein n=1 Tax=Lepeophtheirus salmonis TaxID=72036 RepID=A0A0K2UU81_LEPSM
MFDFQHAFNIDVKVDEWLRVWLESVFPASSRCDILNSKL